VWIRWAGRAAVLSGRWSGQANKEKRHRAQGARRSLREPAKRATPVKYAPHFTGQGREVGPFDPFDELRAGETKGARQRGFRK
jgi:hypothetical protein